MDPLAYIEEALPSGEIQVMVLADRQPCRGARSRWIPRRLLLAHRAVYNHLHHRYPKHLQRTALGEIRYTDTVPLCPNCHDNVHRWIAAALSMRPFPKIHPELVELAREAVTRYQRDIRLAERS